jgi:FkbM family methyltransferase
MTFISYAQNNEDVMLWRCFKNVKNGFYIDVGAQDPIYDSVTKAFYDKGWTGINIEPMQWALEDLQSQRLNDLNLQIAIGESQGVLDIWEFKGSGLSTAKEEFAERHIKSGRSGAKVQVKMRTLAEVCENYVTSPIHFMKIDVEGYEKEVLLGANFVKFRPQLVLIESTEPNSQVENHLEWEHILLENDYIFCYADGLNRFYLSQESEQLATHFKYPPNVFDEFIKSKISLNHDLTKFEIHNTSSEALIDLSNQERSNLINQVNNSIVLTDYEKKRINMTISCSDSDSIPKVAIAGKLIKSEGKDIQFLHNGLKIIEGCYYGPWMTKIIEILKGHHEPQQEFAFFQVLEQLRRNPSPWGSPRMIELGSFWAYYSMWFLKDFPEGSTYCFEPDPKYLEVGRQNFELNNLNGKFINATVSSQQSILREFQCESDGLVISVPALNFSGVVSATEQINIDIVLVDIRGAEIPLLQNLSEVLEHTKIRFMAISTHDVEISGSSITHQLALELLIQSGAHIILEHSVSESFSGDGFILASFLEADKSLNISISYNRSRNSLFGEWEPRMQKLQEVLTEQRDQLTEQRDQLTEQRDQLKQEYSLVTESRVWRYTRPLRILIHKVRRR